MNLNFFASTQVLTFVGLVVVTLGAFGSGTVALGVFYVALTLWAFLLTYRLVIMNADIMLSEEELQPTVSQLAIEKRPDLFVEKVIVDERPMVVPTSPAQLPVGAPLNLPTVGYEQYVTFASLSPQATAAVEVENDAELARALEAQAHKAHVLLSTDALRHFMATVPASAVPSEVLASVIALGKQKYPSEDGWVVINESRMREACVTCLTSAFPASSSAPYVPTVVPAGAGSLAEMIAAGNLGAAYSLIGHRPMFALADAVADFDALYRARNGQDTNTSALLKEVTATLSTETIKAITVALTSALDGTYTDEAEAVKTAIMKAIKVIG